MTLVAKDRVLETSTTTGTGAFTLGGAVTGFRAFSSVCSVGDTCYYLIEHVDSNGNPDGDWETGLGTYSATNTLTRTTVKASSNSNAAVSFGSGTKRVSIGVDADYLASLSGGGSSTSGSYGGIENYSFSSHTTVSVASAPTTPTAISGMTLTIPASTVARTFMVNAMVTWNTGTHGMRGDLMVDGAVVFPGGTNTEPNPVASGDGAYWLGWVGVLVSIPGDGASHTISCAWSAQTSTSGITIQERSMVAMSLASGTGPVLLSEVVTSGSQANVTFSSIPATYRNLRIMVSARGDAAAASAQLRLQFNGDTAANYEWQATYFTNTTSVSGGTATTQIAPADIPAASASTGAVGLADITISNYIGTIFHKSVLFLAGLQPGSSGTSMSSINGYGRWKNTAAISSVKVFLSSGNFVDGSIVSIYGMM